MEKAKITKYCSYNQIKKDNKVLVAIDIDEFHKLSKAEQKKYQLVMLTTKDKIVKPPIPPEMTDHELLLLILSKVEGLEHRMDNLEHRMDNLEHRIDNIVKLNNLKE